jgi:hypothetical protein
MKWQNYFCDDNMSADKLWDRNFPHTAIPGTFWSYYVFEPENWLGKTEVPQRKKERNLT